MRGTARYWRVSRKSSLLQHFGIWGIVLSGKCLRRISVFVDVFRGIAVLGIPQRSPAAEKKIIIITMTPAMQAGS